MLSAISRKKRIGMLGHVRIRPMFVVAVITFLVTGSEIAPIAVRSPANAGAMAERRGKTTPNAAIATSPKTIQFGQTRIIIEVNATAGDAGIQIFVDADGWRKLEVFDPKGQKIFDVLGSGSVGRQGVTELFFESAEPSFAEQSLDELFTRFPAGNYTFKGTTVDGQSLNGKAPLKHNIPAGPQIDSRLEGAVLDPTLPIVIDWQPVSNPFPGSASVNIVGYQVIVEQVNPQPLRVFSVNLPPTVTKVTVSPEFLQPKAEYIVEVLAIEASGNQTISEAAFNTQ